MVKYSARIYRRLCLAFFITKKLCTCLLIFLQKPIVKGGNTMAKDMLDAVFEAEEQCAKREADAKSAAARKSETAKRDAELLKDKAKQTALADAEALYAQARAEGEKELKNALDKASVQCGAMSETAQKNRSRVIELAVKQLVK